MRYALFALVLLVASPAFAREFRVNQVPNGPEFSCDLCHDNGNFGYVNPFGVNVLDALSGGNVQWAELAARDADNDGYTNGEELGDPNGLWRSGQPHPGGRPSHPGYYESNLCGDGILQDNEQCENDDVGEVTCQSEGYFAGIVVCNSICQIDSSFCINCGNGQVDSDEECEGADLDNRTCAALGYDGGTLACRNNCTLDVSMCEGDPTPVCGDGIIVGSEQCEGQNLGGASCVTAGFADGGILACNSDCTFDTDRCLGLNSNEEEERTPTPGNGGPELPPGAFANDDDGGCSVGGAGGLSAWLFMLLAFGRRRRR